jgi:creatinine amidohydrolase
VARAKLKRLLILNSHGGNPPAIALASMRLRSESGLLVVQAHWEDLAEPQALKPDAAPAEDWHAGWIETSVMLHLRPDLVRMERAEAGELRHPEGLPPSGPARWAWMTTDLNPRGVVGDPRLATAELGARLVARTVDGLSKLVERIAAADWPPEQNPTD